MPGRGLFYKFNALRPPLAVAFDGRQGLVYLYFFLIIVKPTTNRIINMKPNFSLLVSAAVLIVACCSCFGLGKSQKAEISGTLWKIDSYNLRIDGEYNQTKGFLIDGMITDQEWVPGSLTVNYIWNELAKNSMTKMLLGDSEEVSISDRKTVLFLNSHLGGPWNVEYNPTKDKNEVKLTMSYERDFGTVNEFILLKRVRNVSAGESIRL